MCQCFYCTNGQVQTFPGVRTFEEFVNATSVVCKLGKKIGCQYCTDFFDITEESHHE